MNNVRYIELLSPAQNLEYGIAAINYGADAVYIGANKFGARASVGNSTKDIEKLCRYAHLYNAKVYATLNTILYENELEQARNLVFELYDAGIDAIIIQDTAFLMMDLPPIQIFASTQMHNYELERIKFFDKIGISRFILARELNLKQIQEIRENIKAELEFFVHGALCVGLSGRCYASFHSTGYSGNRGECKQICRLRYDLFDAKGNTIIKQKHLLSLKDLNLSDYLEKLVDAGISSFKIEGRLKDINYVKNITAFYRKKIDELIERKQDIKKTSKGNIYLHFEPNPARTFSRGFTNYFIDDNHSKKANFETPKSIGQFIGVVSKVDKNKILIDTNEVIHNADGLCYFTENGLEGFLVNKVENKWVIPNKQLKIEIGVKIYRNQDYEFEKLLSQNKTRRKLPIDIELNIENEYLKIKYLYEDMYAESKIAFETSSNPKQIDIIENQLRKTNDTPFEIKNLINKVQIPIFVKISEINSIRRQLLNSLEKVIIENHQRLSSKITLKTDKFPIDTVDYSENISNSLAEKFYLLHGTMIKEKAYEIISKKGNKIIMTTKYCIKREIGECPKINKKNNNKKYHLQNAYTRYELEFDCVACLMKLRAND
ncbi:MAG TPA: U32 family peptidase [Candidatus Kapabacteria bacterium]|nr:U32 family peptidase [Candidatus Kapabacteria bacterium]